MIAILAWIAIIVIAGFLGATASNHKSFDGFSAFMAGGIGILIPLFFMTAGIDGSPVIVESGNYEIVPMEIAEREGYAVEIYRRDKIAGLLINIKKENGMIVPLYLSKNHDNYEIFEDGKNKLDSETKINGSFWTTLLKREVAKPYKIHIPQNSRIARFKNEGDIK